MRLPRPLRLLLFVVCCLLGSTAGAVPARWALQSGQVFQNLGLPALTAAEAMAQDAQGFLWVGSQAGLVRWDGYNTRIYAPDPGVPGALPDNMVRALHVDGDGRLWVGASGGGLTRFDAARDAFVPIAAGSGTAPSDVRAIARRDAASLWVGTHQGLYRLERGADGTERLYPDAQVPASRKVEALLVDRRGRLWVGSRSGLERRDAGAARFEPVALPLHDGAAPAVSALYEDAAGRVWIGTRLRGAFVADAQTSTIQPVHEDVRGSELATDTVRSIVEARPGDIWIATEGGVLRVDAASGRTQRERHDAAQRSSLLDDTVTLLFRDRAGLVWVGTTFGLSRCDPNQDWVDSVYGGPGRTVSRSNVPALLALPDGRLWLAAGEGGIDIVDPQRGRVGALRPDAKRPADALPKARVITMALAPDGSVWLGTQGGLYRADAEGRGVERIAVPGQSATAEVWALQFDGDTLWLGGLDGLQALQGWARPPLRSSRRLDAEVGNQRVTALAPGAGRVLWAALADGLARIDLDTGTVARLRPDPVDPTALPGGFVSSMLVDRQGRLWVAVFGRGIQVEQGTGADGLPRFQRIGVRDGLPNMGVDALLTDRDGRVWASTDDGLAVIDPKTLAVDALRGAQGVGILAYWTGAATAAPGGELVFGGQGGITVVRPERYARRVAAPPRPVITEARVGSRALPTALPRDDAALDIGAGRANVMVEFAAPDYGQPDRHRYAYRLLGFDNDAWVETPASRRLATYTNLPPGQYTLQLRAAAGSGAWSEPLSLPLHVGTLWYQRPEVRIAGGLLALLALAGLMRLRLLVAERQRQRLEAVVAERTAELARQGEALLRSQQQLEQLAYFDALTGLANRRLFTEELRRLVSLAARGGSPFALLLVDLDRFKQVNDLLGHDVGDALLVDVARRLESSVRDADRVARLGGDEFAVLLTQASPESIEAACVRIVVDLASAPALAGRPLEAGASIGVAMCPHDADDPQALYKAADIALYQAKRRGRSTWRRWQADSVPTMPAPLDSPALPAPNGPIAAASAPLTKTA